jgi:outer membrane biosynthesis protein TonB
MKNFLSLWTTALRAASRTRGARAALVVSQLLVLLLAVQPEVPAQEGGAPEGVVPAPAGTDVETLRKLLGLPSRAAEEAKPVESAPAAEAEPAPAASEPAEVAAPEPSKPSKSSKTTKTAAKPKPKPKPVAKAPAKKPAKPVAKAAPKKEAAPVEAEAPAPEEEAIEETAEAGGEVEEGSPDDVPPAGTVVSAANMERWKHLLGPSIQWAVSRGATLPVVDATPMPLEPHREDATRKYASQVTLSPDKNSMRNYVAGIPFPLVTDDDPDVAIKMMFNFEGRISVDDVAVRNLSCDTGRIPPGRGFEVERHYDIDAFRRIFYTGRLRVDPKPTWVTPDGIRYREMLGALQEPFDLKGAGFSYFRYLDPKRHDDSWLYFPQMKRVRRLSSAQRSEGVFGQDVDLDSYAGYAGNPAWSDWKYLGKKTVLGVMHAKNLPAKYLPAPAEFLPDDVWEPREVYILLAVSRLGGYNFGQRVIYLDRESLLIPYTEIYDLKGALWKSLIQTWKFGQKPIPTAKRAVYDYDQFYIPALSMVDIQQNHATRCSLPGSAYAGEEGWYYNFGDAEGTTEDVFTVSHFIQAGR